MAMFNSFLYVYQAGYVTWIYYPQNMGTIGTPLASGLYPDTGAGVPAPKTGSSA